MYIMVRCGMALWCFQPIDNTHITMNKVLIDYIQSCLIAKSLNTNHPSTPQSVHKITTKCPMISLVTLCAAKFSVWLL